MKQIRSLYESYREQISYLFWGGMTTLVSYASYFIFARLCALDPLVANVLSWVCAVAFAFVVNKLFVFRSASWQPAVALPELWKFISARIFSFVLEMAIMAVFVKLLHINDLVVKIAASVIVVIVNYFLSKWIIFNRKG